MLPYLLDDNFKRIDAIEGFETFIWTERWQDAGDMELDIPYSPAMYNALSTGKYMSIDESDRLMRIMTVTRSTNDDGADMIKVVGEDAIEIFKNRTVANRFSKSSKIRFSDATPIDLALRMFTIGYVQDPSEIFRTNYLYGDKIDMTGWNKFYTGCNTSVSNKILKITPDSDSSGTWHTRTANVGDDSTALNGIGTTIDMTKEYMLTYKASSDVNVAIVVKTPGRANTSGYEEEDILPDSNGKISFPSYATAFKFFRITPKDTASRKPITVSSPSLEEYRGYKYDVSFNGDTIDTEDITYDWTGTAWQSISIAKGQVWTLPGSDTMPITFKTVIGNISPETDLVYLETEAGTSFDLGQSLCKQYELGFKLTYRFVAGKGSSFTLTVYTGNDRTSGQTLYPPVVFSKELDNLSNISEVKSISGYKNVCIVSSPAGSKVVYSDDASAGSLTSTDLRIMHTKVNSLNDVDDVDTYLINVGRRALANQQIVYGLDGELSQYSSYGYSTDYELGDLVEMRGDNGITNQMRVTEQTFIQDTSGYRSYPTLVVNELVTPGSWLSSTGNLYWTAAAGYWEAQP